MLPDPLPLFPLGAVLFPGTEIGLRIFETRYLDMIRRSLRQETPFGIVAIRHGAEVGAAEPFTVGTLARVTDWTTTEQGLLGLTVRGAEKFRFTSVGRAPDGLYLARGAAVVAESEGAADLLPAATSSQLQRLHARAGSASDAGMPDVKTVAEANRVCWNLALQLPLSLADQQALLEADSLSERIDRLLSRVEAPADDAEPDDSELKEQLGE